MRLRRWLQVLQKSDHWTSDFVSTLTWVAAEIALHLLRYVPRLDNHDPRLQDRHSAPGATSASNYTAAAGASDLEAILNFLNINKTLILAHDKGVDLATSLALDTPELVDRIILAEYSPPGYGYSTGNDVISNDLVEIYIRTLAKPGFLRAIFQYFAAAWQDEAYFKSKINTTGKLQGPTLVMGGEAPFSPVGMQEQ
ncbi:hypothetical protein LTR37_013548 [Vermiconidia calcicola]|uniref:Uncharacterized protein n=1 Tax=Vermiconidia calcicola TaxID=1690605 RepID=A0ACC3MVY7_9PEZI|nr:hypothetical protein LTR37_013548 [Vermiconidia calcicola]